MHYRMWFGSPFTSIVCPGEPVWTSSQHLLRGSAGCGKLPA